MNFREVRFFESLHAQHNFHLQNAFRIFTLNDKHIIEHSITEDEKISCKNIPLKFRVACMHSYLEFGLIRRNLFLHVFIFRNFPWTRLLLLI